MRGCQAAQLPRGYDVDGEYPLNIRPVDIERVFTPPSPQAGIVDQDVDSAESVDSRVYQPVEVAVIGHVAFHGHGFAATAGYFFHHILGFRQCAVADHH